MQGGATRVGIGTVAVDATAKADRAPVARSGRGGADDDGARAADGPLKIELTTAEGRVVGRRRTDREDGARGHRDPAGHRGGARGAAFEKVHAGAGSGGDEEVASDGEATTNPEATGVVGRLDAEDDRGITIPEGAGHTGENIARDHDGAAVDLGVSLVGIGTGQGKRVGSAFDEVAAHGTADDTTNGDVAAGHVPDPGGTRAHDVAHGDIAKERERAGIGVEVALKDQLVVQGDVGGDEVVVADITADETAVDDEAAAAEGEVVADPEGTIGIHTHIADKAGVAGGEGHIRGVAVDKARRVPRKIAGLGTDLDANLIGGATREDVFEEAGTAPADEHGAELDRGNAAAAAEEVFTVGGRPDR